MVAGQPTAKKHLERYAALENKTTKHHKATGSQLVAFSILSYTHRYVTIFIKATP